MKLERAQAWVVVTFAAAIMTAVVPIGSSTVRAQAIPPDAWRPLVADYQETSPSGSGLVGRYWRGADGSIRLETGRSLNTLDVINIQNVTRQEVYEFKTERGWLSAMLSPGVSSVPVQEISLAGSTVTTTSFEGRTALRRTAASGVVDVYVPELNFLRVDRTRPDGRRQVLQNVRVDMTISPTLFIPPAGNHVGRIEGSPLHTEILMGSDILTLPQ